MYRVKLCCCQRVCFLLKYSQDFICSCLPFHSSFPRVILKLTTVSCGVHFNEPVLRLKSRSTKFTGVRASLKALHSDNKLRDGVVLSGCFLVLKFLLCLSISNILFARLAYMALIFLKNKWRSLDQSYQVR